MTYSEPNAIMANHVQRLLINYVVEIGPLQHPQDVSLHHLVGSVYIRIGIWHILSLTFRLFRGLLPQA